VLSAAALGVANNRQKTDGKNLENNPQEKLYQ
jgi:hypothetical protein